MTKVRGPDEQRLLDALRDVHDPCCADRGISIVDMGVVEDVRVEGAHVEVDLLLDDGLVPVRRDDDRRDPRPAAAPRGVQTVDVRVVWDPVWTPDRLSPSAQDKLTMPLDELEPYRRRRIAQTEGA